MKIIKKGLGVLLIAVLLLNLIGTTAFAAVMPNRAMSIRARVLETEIKAGDTIHLIANIESTPVIQYWNTGCFEVGIDNTYFSIDQQFSSLVTTGYGYENMLNPNTWVEDCFTEMLPEEKTAYNWNQLIQLGLVDDTGEVGWVDATVEGGVDIFALKINVAPDTPDGVYYVGFSYSGYDQMLSYVNDKTWGACYQGFGVGLDYGISDPDGQLYDLSEAVVAITVGDAASDPVVTNNGVQVKWGADNAHVQLGYKATISGLDITTTLNTGNGAYEVNELSEVGVLFSTTLTNPTLADVGSGATKVTSNTLYDNGDGTYSFRAIVKNAPIDNTTVINAVMYITLADGTTTYYSLSGTTSPKAAYDAGRLNGMPDFGA